MIYVYHCTNRVKWYSSFPRCPIVNRCSDRSIAHFDYSKCLLTPSFASEELLSYPKKLPNSKILLTAMNGLDDKHFIPVVILC